jgi:hypothetical protein
LNPKVSEEVSSAAASASANLAYMIVANWTALVAVEAKLK